MTIKVLSSSSKGNCYIIDNGVNTLILECGISYDSIIKNVDIERLSGVLISHCHNDHSKARKDFEKWYIPCLSTDNITPNKPFTIDTFKILAIPVLHNVECFAFWIRDLVDNKDLLFVTDAVYMPNIIDKNFDCMLLEANYSKEYVTTLEEMPTGCENHSSIEDLTKWLKLRQHGTKNLILIHLSSRGNIRPESALNSLKQYADNVYVATNGLKIEI